MNFLLVLELELELVPSMAEGLAGAVLLWIADVVRDRSGPALEAALRDAIPELREWGQAAPTLAVLEEDLPPPSSGSDEDELVGLLARFGVKAPRATLTASLTLRFLASRLPPESARAIAGVMPLLIGRRAG